MISHLCASVFLLEMWVMKIATCLLGPGWGWDKLLHVTVSGQSLSHGRCSVDAAVADDGDNKAAWPS